MSHLSKWIIVFVLFWLIGYLLNFYALDSDLSWTYDLYTKKLGIAKQLRGKPRIFLLGGSATHYSINAVQLENNLNIYCINFGLHAGLGLNAILASVENEIRAGDLIVLSPEYGILGKDEYGWLSAPFGVAIGRPGIGGVGLKQKAIEIFRGGMVLSTSLGKSIMKILFGSKGRANQSIDSRGDVVVFLYDIKPQPRNIPDEISRTAILRLTQFRDEILAKGAKLIFVLPPILVEDRTFSYNSAKKIAAKLTEIAPVVYENDYLNIETDPSLFSDTFYHLNLESRQIRTAILSEKLKRYAGTMHSSISNSSHWARKIRAILVYVKN
jgi:hypothetical protein